MIQKIQRTQERAIVILHVDNINPLVPTSLGLSLGTQRVTINLPDWKQRLTANNSVCGSSCTLLLKHAVQISGENPVFIITILEGKS